MIVILIVSLFFAGCYGELPLSDLPDVKQFNLRHPSPSTAYTWWYSYPGQYHQEDHDGAGTVQGKVGYIDANGSPVQWSYNSDPVNGFRRVDDLPVNPTFKNALSQGSAAFIQQYNRPIVDVGITNRFVPEKYGNLPSDQPIVKPEETEEDEVYVAPGLPNSIIFRTLSQYPTVSRYTSNTGYSGHFLVPAEDVQSIGGVSAAAVKYDAAPIAAVHDAKVPRYHY